MIGKSKPRPGPRKSLALLASEVEAIKKLTVAANAIPAAVSTKPLFGFSRHSVVENEAEKNPLDMKLPYYARGRLLNIEVNANFKITVKESHYSLFTNYHFNQFLLGKTITLCGAIKLPSQ